MKEFYLEYIFENINFMSLNAKQTNKNETNSKKHIFQEIITFFGEQENLFQIKKYWGTSF